jgi:UPF0755 protein
MLRLINRLETIVLLLLLSFLYYLSLPVHPPKNLQISDSSVDFIISKLQKQGIEVGGIDRLLLRQMPPPKAGWVYLGRDSMNRLEFLRTLASSRGRFKAVTLIPGETTVIFLKQLARSLEKNATRLQEAYRRMSPYPEGGILAESYNIPLDYNESRIVNYLLNLSERRYRKLAADANLSYNSKDWLRVLTVASIVQKEAADRLEMPLVASVIYNRLAKRMRLQMDGTLNYGLYSHVRVTPERIREDNSTYNTYKHRGLPEVPVCNVSAAAIEAALHPAKTDYLYFFRNARGKHNFFTSYKAHLKEVRKKRRELKKAQKRAKERKATPTPEAAGNPPAQKAAAPAAGAPATPAKSR